MCCWLCQCWPENWREAPRASGLKWHAAPGRCSTVPSPRADATVLLLCEQEPGEELLHCAWCVEGQDVRNVLVGAHDHEASVVAVDTAGVEDFGLFRSWRERLVVIDQPVASLCGAQQLRQGGGLDFVMALLQDAAHIDHGVDVCPCWGDAARHLEPGIRELLQTGFRVIDGQPVAESVDASATVGSGDVTELERFRIADAGDGCRVEALADGEPGGEALMLAAAGEDGRLVMGAHAGRVAPLAFELFQQVGFGV